jgi:glycosyltransferase involved in cell wall biosynthesis
MVGRKDFDGIICIGGEDWWYHNRGHFDFQIMRRLAQKWPVLFVNSLGVRMPGLSNKGLFAERIARKVRSLARGLVRVENGFWVYSPASIPGETGRRLSHWALAPQIRLAAARAGIFQPLVWMHCPAGAALIDELGAVATVLQRTDRFEAFPEGDGKVIGRQIDALRRAADLVVYAAPHLMEQERGAVRRQLLVTHGVELEAFLRAGNGNGAAPAEVAGLPRPRVGFIGGIDAHTFDPELFLEVARRLSDAHFVMIGSCSLPEGWCTLANVSFLGRRPYEAIAGYMAATDALIMPWNESDWIKACNPIKLKEYLAVGRPVVTTDFPALGPWRNHVRVAGSAPDFAAAVKAALADRYDPGPARLALAGETWDAKAALVASAILDLGLSFAPAGTRAEPRAAAAAT